MFGLRITSLVEAKAFAWWPTHTLSLVDRFMVEPSGQHHAVIEFTDTEKPTHPRAPTRTDIKAILAFTAPLGLGDRLLVHCQAGMRRSTAAAIGILIAHGSSISAAFDRAYAIRPIMVPNLLVLEHFDDALGLNGALLAHGKLWIFEHYSKIMRQAVVESLGDPASDRDLRTAEMRRLMNLSPKLTPAEEAATHQHTDPKREG